MLKMSQRLHLAASMVDKGAKVADIGCDHAYISIFLIQNNIADSVIAMDVRKGPLEIAKKNIAEYGLSDKIETRLSDGFSSVQKGESNTAVITGMGGLLITGIIEAGLSKMTSGYRLVLGPQSELFEVREYLARREFRILDEKMLCEEGKFYTLIKVEYCPGEKCKEADNKAVCSSENMPEETTRMEYKAKQTYGPVLLEQKNEVLKEYLLKTLQVNEGILEKVSGETEAGKIRRDEIAEAIELIRFSLRKFYSH